MLVAMTILRTPGGGLEKTSRWLMVGMREWRGMMRTRPEEQPKTGMARGILRDIAGLAQNSLHFTLRLGRIWNFTRVEYQIIYPRNFEYEWNANIQWLQI